MGKYKENPKYDVISVRVTDEEKRRIQNMALLYNMKTTELVREILFDSGILVDKQGVQFY